MNETPQTNQMGFETALEQLQIAIRKLEAGELSLDDSLKEFQNGVQLARVCQEHIKAAEQQVEILTHLNTSSEAVTLQPFVNTKANGQKAT